MAVVAEEGQEVKAVRRDPWAGPRQRARHDHHDQQPVYGGQRTRHARRRPHAPHSSLQPHRPFEEQLGGARSGPSQGVC
eukprot:11203886-Lingulodinium_polyedra.AAC.1